MEDCAGHGDHAMKVGCSQEVIVEVARSASPCRALGPAVARKSAATGVASFSLFDGWPKIPLRQRRFHFQGLGPALARFLGVAGGFQDPAEVQERLGHPRLER